MPILRSSKARTKLVWLHVPDQKRRTAFVIRHNWWRGYNEQNLVCPHCGHANDIWRSGMMFGADQCETCLGLISWWPERQKPPKPPVPEYHGWPGPYDRMIEWFEDKLWEAGCD